MEEFIQIEGYHGTDANNIESIIGSNFRLSLGDDEWLGDGVYFFVEGISKPENDAVKWSIANTWDKQLKRNTYLRYSIIKTNIVLKANTFLDLTTTEGMEVFTYLRNKYISKIAENGKRLQGEDANFKDGHLINNARKEFNFCVDVVKGNFYIKFTKERIFNINFRVPNTTIIAVYNIDSCIKKESIEVVKIKNI